MYCLCWNYVTYYWIGSIDLIIILTWRLASSDSFKNLSCRNYLVLSFEIKSLVTLNKKWQTNSTARRTKKHYRSLYQWLEDISQYYIILFLLYFMWCGQPVGRAAGAFALTNSSVRTSDLSHLLISDHRELSKVRVVVCSQTAIQLFHYSLRLSLQLAIACQ